MFEIKKGTKQGDPLSSLLFNTVLQKALEDDFPRWQKKEGMGIYLSGNDHDCLTNMRFADDVLLFASSKEQLQKCYANSRGVLKKWDSGSIQGRRKFSATKARTSDQNLRSMTKVEITDKRRKHEILGPDDYFPATGDDRNQKLNEGCLGDVPQVQTGAAIEKLLAQTSTPAVRRNGNPDDELRIRNMDTHRRAPKND